MPLSLSFGRDRVKPAGSSESSRWTRFGFPSRSFPNNGGHFLDSRAVPFCKVAKPRQHGGGPVLVTAALRRVEVLVDLIDSNSGDRWRRRLIRCTCSPCHDTTAVAPGVEPVGHAEVPGGKKDPHSAVDDLGLCKVQACL